MDIILPKLHGACQESYLKSRDKNGYAIKKVKGKHRKAHRVAWEQAYGPIPPGMCVCHHCDNPPCVNPNHLFLGTNYDNVQDKVRKGRAKGIPQPGRKNGMCKLLPIQVFTLRELKGFKTCQQFADIFGISNQQVSRIQTGQRWT